MAGDLSQLAQHGIAGWSLSQLALGRSLLIFILSLARYGLSGFFPTMNLSWAVIARSPAVTDCSPGTHLPSSSLPVYFANLKRPIFFPSIIWTHPLTNWSQNTMDLWLPQDPKWVLNGFPAPGHPFYSHATPVSAKSLLKPLSHSLFPGNTPECPGFSSRCGLFRASHLMPDSSCSEHRYLFLPREALLSLFLTHPAPDLSTQWRGEKAVS